MMPSTPLATTLLIWSLLLGIACPLFAAPPAHWPRMLLDRNQGERPMDETPRAVVNEPPTPLISYAPPQPGGTEAHAQRLTEFRGIDLSSELSPVLRLGGDWFILQRGRRLYVWRVGEPYQHRLFQFPQLHAPHEAALFPISVPFGGGTFIVAGDPDGQNGLRHLVWWDPSSAEFVTALRLPVGLHVDGVIPLDKEWALICGRPGGTAKFSEVGQRRQAFVVALKNRQLSAVQNHPVALRMTLDAAGIEGPVEGVGWVSPGKLSFETEETPAWEAAKTSPQARKAQLQAAPSILDNEGPPRKVDRSQHRVAYQALDTPEMRELLTAAKIPYARDSGQGKAGAPLMYNTTRCAWQPKVLPNQMWRGSRHVDITPHWLPDGRVLIRQAAWGFDDQGKPTRQLKIPLLWNPDTKSWIEVERPAAALAPTSALFNLWPGDPLVNTIQSYGAYEVLNPETLRWTPYFSSLGWRRHGGEHDTQALAVLSDGSLLVPFRDSSAQKRFSNLAVRRATTTPWLTGSYAEHQFLLYMHQAAAMRTDGGMLFVGWPDTPELNPSWRMVWPEQRVQWLPSGAERPESLPLPPVMLVKPELLALADGSFLLMGGKSEDCPEGPECASLPPQPAMRLQLETRQWEVLPGLSVPAVSSRTTRAESPWRGDRGALVRVNGDVVWLDNQGMAPGPVRSTLMRWRPGMSHAEPVARLLRGRSGSTLSEAPRSDGQPPVLTVMGGEAQLELVAEEKTCFDCPDTLFSLGPLVAARSSEVLDEAVTPPLWRAGPRVPVNAEAWAPVRLANGRVFRLLSTRTPIRAEIAEADLSQWTALPELSLGSRNCNAPRIRCRPMGPASSFAAASMRVARVSVTGNQVFLLPEPERERHEWYDQLTWDRYLATMLIWDDDAGAWFIEHRLSRTGEPQSVWLHPDGQVRIIYPRAVERLDPRPPDADPLEAETPPQVRRALKGTKPGTGMEPAAQIRVRP